MYLLNTANLQLEEFIAETPSYAILSHTWEDEEVLFKDIHDLDKASLKKGFNKIQRCCQLAKSEGYQYAWVDTCCIDKSSSAELSEAINSMFAYYMNSGVCYVYLDKHFPNVDWNGLSADDIQSTRWVTRGWTLQELIAPTGVCFYDKQWRFCGTRDDLLQPLTEATKVNMKELRAAKGEHESRRNWMLEFSVAQRMSWVSRRQTTRPEDIAYCLFGLFDVHMPPLYGEGAEKAFLRLQEEIIKKSTDMSILSWYNPNPDTPADGALASSPALFSPCQDIRRARYTAVAPFKLTSGGLRIKMPLIQYGESRDAWRECIAILPNCVYSEKDSMLYDHGMTNTMGLSLYSFTMNSEIWYRYPHQWKVEHDGTFVPNILVARSELQNATIRKIYIR